MADEHDLIKIPDFVRKYGVTGEEDVPLADRTGTFKAKASDIINAVASVKGYLTTDALVPYAKNISKLTVEVNGKLDRSQVIDNLNSSAPSFALSARQGKILSDLIGGFAGQIGSGIIGEAIPATVPLSEGFAIYTTSTQGTYSNFKDSNGASIVVSQSDIDSGFVQLWGNNNVWKKQITLIEVSDPVFI